MDTPTLPSGGLGSGEADPPRKSHCEYGGEGSDAGAMSKCFTHENSLKPHNNSARGHHPPPHVTGAETDAQHCGVTCLVTHLGGVEPTVTPGLLPPHPSAPVSVITANRRRAPPTGRLGATWF